MISKKILPILCSFVVSVSLISLITSRILEKTNPLLNKGANYGILLYAEDSGIQFYNDPEWTCDGMWDCLTKTCELENSRFDIYGIGLYHRYSMNDTSLNCNVTMDMTGSFEIIWYITVCLCGISYLLLILKFFNPEDTVLAILISLLRLPLFMPIIWALVNVYYFDVTPEPLLISRTIGIVSLTFAYILDTINLVIIFSGDIMTM